MPTLLNPYVIFDGTAREALEFYHGTFGGNLELTTYLEGGMSNGPEDENRIMHGELRSAAGFTLMAGDAPPGQPAPSGSAVSISLGGDDEAELRGYWDRLSGTGSVELPLERAPWGDLFGMTIDRFGVSWMVSIGEV